MELTSFIHLNVHSNFSMLEGANTISQFVERAAYLEFPGLALTDTDGVYGAVDFVRACRKAGIQPILGTELTEPQNEDDHVPVFNRRRAVLLARNQRGYESICRVVSERHLRNDFNWEESMVELPVDVVVISSDQSMIQKRSRCQPDASATYLEVQSIGGGDGRRERNRLLEFATQHRLNAVATNGVRFVQPDGWEIHQLLTALKCNATIGTLPVNSCAPHSAYLLSAKEMAQQFQHAPGALSASLDIAESCDFQLDLTHRKLPRFHVPGGGDAYLFLRGVVLQGLSERYSDADMDMARQTCETELQVIEKMDLADYFLICRDIIRYARLHDIPCLGRGSAANSIVSYCLYITHVDPIRHNLFFERFLNEQRTSLPDFDLDFGTEDREVILDYIFDLYGSDHVAMIGTHCTFQTRGSFREVAVALGYPISEVDSFIKTLPHFSSPDNLEDKLKSSPQTRDLPLQQEPFATIHRYAARIGGYPRHMATHPCGLVITPEPIYRFMPLQRGDKGLAITQWSMYPVEDAGLLKIDILGQKGLEVISHCRRTIRCHGHVIPDQSQRYLNDPLTRQWMREGRTVGCFYIESPAMIGLIRQARCDDFECLTALSSIIRPGVANYGGKHAYLRRHLKLEPETVLHPLLSPILQDTRGCLIYQEQVIRIASELAGLTLAQADNLRRLMSFKKNRKQLSDYREQFYDGCRQKGIDEEVIDEIYRQVESFAGYAFCKAHSASFALESFESMYLKAHYPAEFMAAVLSGGGGYYGSLEYLEEARRLGIIIHPPCINTSVFRFFGHRNHLRVGLVQVKNLREEIIHRIETYRQSNGPFTDLITFLAEIKPSPTEARNLAQCGAFRSLGKTIPESMWGIELYFSGHHDTSNGNPADYARKLWRKVPSIPDPPLPHRLAWELEILGMTPSAHPLKLFPVEVKKCRHLRPVIRSVDMNARAGRQTYMLGWRIIGKKTRTRNDHREMLFVTFSDEWGRFEVTFFPNSYENNAKELGKGHGPFLLKGQIQVEFGVSMLVADNVWHLARSQPDIRSTYGPLRRPFPLRKR